MNERIKKASEVSHFYLLFIFEDVIVFVNIE